MLRFFSCGRGRKGLRLFCTGTVGFHSQGNRVQYGRLRSKGFSGRVHAPSSLRGADCAFNDSFAIRILCEIESAGQ